MLPPPPRRGPPPRAPAYVRAARYLPFLALAACGRGGGGGSQVTFALAGPLQQDYGIATK
jgi:hypothetical protein